MGFLAIFIGFAALVVLCLLNVNVMVAAFGAAMVVTLLAGLPFTDTLITAFFTRFGTIAGALFPMFFFGAILAELSSRSGAVISIADTVSNSLFRNARGQGARYRFGFLSVILASAILCYGGINAAVALIAIYPIAMAIFAKAGIPKRFVMGAICGGAFTFALSGPGSPQPTNVVAMVIGTPSACGLIAGIVGAVVEITIMVAVLSRMTEHAVRRGAQGVRTEEITAVGTELRKPAFLIALAPFVFLVVVFNLCKLNIALSILAASVVAAALFFPQLGLQGIFNAVNKGARSSLTPIGAIAAVNGFAAVVQSVPEYQQLIDRLLHSHAPAVVLLIGCVALICMMTGGSTTGTQIALPILAPVLTKLGMPLSFIHRVGTFSATVLDSLPNSGAVIMALDLADLKMKDGYPAVFVSTVLATTCGTLAVALIMTLFPALP